MHSSKRWQLRSSNPEAELQLSEAAGVPLAIGRLLIQRGIDTPEAARTFLNPSLDQLHSPLEMLGMQIAVTRVQKAISAKERILIYGDYDVDGTMAVVILKTCIELLGGTADFHVPHRIREGYGMKDDVIESAAESGIRLVISVDTGIRAFQAADTARRVGLDLIVTDHHLPEIGEALPYALAVLNPNQVGCGYRCKELCGAGVAFKIAQALLTAAGPRFERLIPSFIKVVAIATIADSVPLVGENRVFAKLGLQGLRRPVNGGLKALLQVSQLDRSSEAISSTDIAFRVAPRINAAGRMDIAQDVVDLFTSRDEARTRELAEKLNALNGDRQAEEARIISKIHALLDNDAKLSEAFCLVIAGDGWHRGVIGIAATRVVERTGKPALVIAIDGDEAHGSGRSIPAFHLLDALESKDCRPLFNRFGGHAHAVGFSMHKDNVEPLRHALEAYARTRLKPEDFTPILHADAEITLSEITPAWVQCLKMLEPYGMGNREPVFVARGLRLQQPPRILKEKHIKLRLAQDAANGKCHSFDALGWRMAERLQELPLLVGEIVDLAFTVDENTHPQFGGLQLIICDLMRTKATAAQSQNASIARG